jgi:outer membrane protein assembly factor BamA
MPFIHFIPQSFKDIFYHFFSIKKDADYRRLLLMKFSLSIILVFAIIFTKAQNQHPDSSFANSHLSKLRVSNIEIIGNKKTKDYIILREMQIKPGDSVIIKNLSQELERSREFIYNTTLFVWVKITPRLVDAYDFDIIIEVKERWYIFPIPYFELADRSFNEWLKKYNADFDRVSYGIKFSHFNISGRKDQLSVTFINGFKRNISFEYIAPYTNPALTNGIRIGAGYFQTRELPYKTDYNNNLLYFKNDNFVKSEWYVKAGYSYRKALKKKQTFQIVFRHIMIDDSIILHKNAGFFNNNSSSQNFIELEYKLQNTNVDNVLYPLQGNTSMISVKKQGLQIKGGINQFAINANYKKYNSYPHKWYSSIKLSGEIKLPFEQSYYNQKALGYEENYLRGDEYFVIDGVAFALAKLDLKKKILFFNIPTLIDSKTYNKLPFAMYAKIYADFGYVYSQHQFDSRLNNRFLYSGGFGIDIITLYDFKISIEYSVNQLNQKGLFLHH